MHAKPPRLIRRRRHHAATLRPTTHQHRQAAELRVVQLLYGGVERVQVGVDDVAIRRRHGVMLRTLLGEWPNFTPERGGKHRRWVVSLTPIVPIFMIVANALRITVDQRASSGVTAVGTTHLWRQ